MAVKQFFNTSAELDFPTVLPTLDLDFANSKTLDPRITFTRASGGSYVGADGLIKYAGVNEARFDHDPATGESLGLLIEESRQNFILQSETFSGWGAIDITPSIDNNIINPTGNGGVRKIIENIGNVSNQKVIFFDATVGNNNQFFSHSFFVKPIGNRNVQLNIHNIGSPAAGFSIHYDIKNKNFFNITTTQGCILSSYGAVEYPNGWYKIYATANTTSNNSSGTQLRFHIRIIDDTINKNGLYNGDGVSGLYIWGAQLEQGSFPTSYIPTQSSTRTREADIVYIPNVDKSNWYNKLEGTLSFEHTTVPFSSNSALAYPAFGFGNSIDGGSAQSIQYFIVKRVGNSFFLVRDFVAQGFTTSLDQVGISPPGLTNISSKVSFAYKFNDFALARNGIFIGSDNTGIIPNNSYMLIIGQNNILLNNQQINAHCKYLKYYPKRLPNSQLQSLTS